MPLRAASLANTTKFTGFFRPFQGKIISENGQKETVKPESRIAQFGVHPSGCSEKPETQLNRRKQRNGD
jgi:hypothetical protein